MSLQGKIYPYRSLPGIKRDGTEFEGDYHTDGEWVRWDRGLARKIGGFVRMGRANERARGCDVFTQNGNVYVHYGSAGFVQQATTNVISDTITITYNRTPSGLVPDTNNLWQFGEMYDAGSTTTNIIAHVAPNLANIDNSVEGMVYMGDITGTAALTAITGSNVSGGIAILHPYLFYFGSNGLLGWSVPNQPSDLSGSGSGEGRVTGGKVLFGLQTRAGAGNAPAGLFWATDSLIRAVFVGGSQIFDFDRIATSYSILSSQCVVEYDGIYYWIGTDRFLMYNGVIQELPNEMNRRYFFENLNIDYRQKVWGMKVAAFGEIWWFFVNTLTDSTATECNHVLIYNIREKTWYDTPLMRTTGYSAEIFPHPIMFDGKLNDDGTTNIYKHEEGVDNQVGNTVLAIPSFFESQTYFQDITENEQAMPDGSLNYLRYEPDFKSAGEMTLTVKGRKYPQSTPAVLDSQNFDSTTEKMDIRAQARITTLTIGSNVVGGNYVQGKPLVLVDVGDRRPAGP